MSEATDAMTRKGFLEACMRIERLCADLYHYYSSIYGDNPEAARIWKNAAIEEENHEKQFELALRLINETEFDVSKESCERVQSIQHKLLTLINHIKSTKPDLVTAVSKAVEMEDFLADLHAHSSLNFRDESMQKLFKALGEADRDHINDLQRYRTILCLPQSDMGGQ